MLGSHARRLHRFPLFEEATWQIGRYDDEQLIIVSDRGFSWNTWTPIENVLEGLVEFGAGLGGGSVHRPGRIEVQDERLAAKLGDALAAAEIPVEVREQLPFVENGPSAADEEEPEADDVPWLLGDDTDPDAFRVFVDAAIAFHSATPWRHVGVDDLIHLEVPETGFPYCIVSPNELIAFESLADVETWDFGKGDLTGLRWCRAAYESRSETVPSIVEYWTRHGLPSTQVESRPFLWWSDDVRSDEVASLHSQLAVAMAAIATLDTADWNRGNWSGVVTTPRGPLRVRLRLVHFEMWIEDSGELSPDAINPDDSPQERAIGLVQNAEFSSGLLTSRLAREALESDPLCIPAHMILAREARDTWSKLTRLRAAFAAGETWRSQQAGAIDWQEPIAAAYLQVRLALAERLCEDGKVDEAVEHYHGLLALTPDEDLHITQSLVICLITMESHDAAESILSKVPPTEGTFWTYARALMAYRTTGDTGESRDRLRESITANPFIVPLLASQPGSPDREAAYNLLHSMLRQSEAVTHRVSYTPPGVPDLKVPAELDAPRLVDLIVDALAVDEDLGPAWASTPGAADWVDAHGFDGPESSGSGAKGEIDARWRRADLRADQGRTAAAVEDWNRILELAPENDGALAQRWRLHAKLGNYVAALADLERALELDDEDAINHSNLAWFLASCPDDTVRDGARAIRHATRAAEIDDFESAFCVWTLAAAHAEAGEFDLAVRWANAVRVIAATGRLDMCARRIALFRDGKPFRGEEGNYPV